MKIKKGDNIVVISGKDRGKKGKVIDVLPVANKIVVEGINIAKKHVRPKKEGEKGQIVELPKAFDVSNAKVICGKCKNAARVGYNIIESSDKKKKEKVRICKKCGQEL